MANAGMINSKQNGQYLDAKGNAVQRNCPEAHIPLDAPVENTFVP